jgi:hypothetical protein
MRRILNDALLSIGAVLLLVMLLAVADGRVRNQLTSMVRSGGPTAEVVDTGRRVQALAHTVLEDVTDVARAHTTLTAFVVIAGALTIFMVRT